MSKPVTDLKPQQLLKTEIPTTIPEIELEKQPKKKPNNKKKKKVQYGKIFGSGIVE